MGQGGRALAVASKLETSFGSTGCVPRMARPLLIVMFAALLVLPAGASAKLGALTQLPGKAGCVAQQNVPKSVKKACFIARFPSREFSDAAVSPDGRNFYVLSISGGLTEFKIAHGRLNPLGHCFSPRGRARCKRVSQLFHTGAIAMSADGRTVYVGAESRTGAAGIVIFGRNRKTGVLTKRGCVGEGGAGGCSTARGLFTRVSEIVPSPDGRSIYVASNSADPIAPKSGAVAVFVRSKSGGLTQLAGTAGCLNGTGADGCAQVGGLGATCCGMAVSADSRNVYVSSSQGMFTPGSPGSQSAVLFLATFTRNALTGALTELGCINKDGSGGCAAVPFRGDQPINEAGAILISPNGRDLYLAHSSTFPDAESGSCGGSDNFVALFTRTPGSGALGSLGQDLATCGSAELMSPDGRSLYASSGDFGSTVSTLARNSGSGLLANAGCIGHQSRGCRPVRHVDAPDRLAIAGRRYVYVLSNDPVEGSTIGVFKRAVG